MPSESSYRKTEGLFGYELRSDVGVPNFFQHGVAAIRFRTRKWARQPKPHIATLPYYDEQFFQTNREYAYNRLDFPPGFLIYGGFPSDSNHINDWKGFVSNKVSLSQLVESAKLKCLDKVSEAHWDAPVWAAELGETCEMIYDTAHRLAKAGSQLRKKQFKKCADTLGLSMKSLRGPKDHWMSYRYGWIPAINDAVDAAETFAASVNDQPDTQRFFAAPSVSSSGRTNFFWFSGPSHTHDTSYDVSGRAAAWLTLKREYPALIAAESFGLVNWPSNAYNLVPLSWVVDWVYPIGDYLAAQTTLLGYKVLDGGISKLRTIKGHTTQFPLRYESGIGPQAEFIGRIYERERWSGSVSILPPAPDLSLNWKRLIDAGSLLHNVFGSVKR